AFPLCPGVEPAPEFTSTPRSTLDTSPTMPPPCFVAAPPNADPNAAASLFLGALLRPPPAGGRGVAAGAAGAAAGSGCGAGGERSSTFTSIGGVSCGRSAMDGGTSGPNATSSNHKMPNAHDAIHEYMIARPSASANS